MTIDARTKLKFVSLALMLALAASLPASGSAEEAGSQPPSDAKATNSGTPSPDSPAAGENAAPTAGGANTEDIDTRITVQPHGPPGKSGKLGEKTNPIQPIKLINPHRRTFSPSRAAHHLMPNASSIPGGQGQNLQQHPGERFESKSVGPAPAIGTASGASSASTGLAKPASTLGREPIFPSTGISPLGANAKAVPRGGIGGASLNHHAVGTGTAGIGGPARTVTGINGTLVRETR